ncbi:MAG: metal-dependent hydrolase [Flavitalea sp.]
MDSLTHIVIGACVGDIIAGKQVGKRAMLYGALMNSLPDVDFIASFFLDPVSDLLAHRGFTHSILFAFIATPVFAGISNGLEKKVDLSYKRWCLFFFIEIMLHLFIDAFNAYGTGWFEPFSHARISFHTLFVADPLFSIVPFIAFIALLILPVNHPRRRTWVLSSLVVCTLYLGISIMHKMSVDREVRAIASTKKIEFKRFLSTPTPLNNLLWFVALEQDSGYYIGYRSVLDSKADMEFTWRPRNQQLVDSIEHEKHLQQLKRFSQGFYTVEKRSDTLVFNDLRFGQVIGWENANNSFAFYYFLTHLEDNELVVQRGRFAGWNKENMKILWRRMKGN